MTGIYSCVESPSTRQRGALKKTQNINQLFVAMNNMAAIDEPKTMSPEEIAEEIAVLRKERRLKKACCTPFLTLSNGGQKRFLTSPFACPKPK
jgi:translation elongation factor EF-1alpha